MTDLVTFGEAMLRLSPPPGERLAAARSFDAYVGGAESNVAVAAAQLGAEAAWLSKLPNSPLGRRVTRELRGSGVRTGAVWADPDEYRLGTYYLERGSSPRGNEVRYDRAGSAVTTVTPGELPLDVVRDANACYVSGVTPALSDRLRETTGTLLETAREAGTTTVFDPAYRPQLWSAERARETYEALLPLVDVLVVDEDDAVEVLDTGDRPVKIVNGLQAEYDCGTVVLRRGTRGAIGLREGEVHEQDAVETETVDPTGSGDAFVGGYLTARLRGDDLADALAVGVAAEAVGRTVEGDQLVATRAEVDSLAARAADDASR
ncbi:MAG: PfkB family carbohydrate kinase [Haloferacaceae archaeon]